MNKFKILAVIVGILVVAEGSAIIHFAQRSDILAKKIAVLEPDYGSLTKEKQALNAKFTNLSGEYEAVKKDRDNIMSQAKILIEQKNRSLELEGLLVKANEKIDSLGKETSDSQNYALSLKEEIKKLWDTQNQLTKERDDLKSAYEKAKNDTRIKQLSAENSDLEKANKELNNNFKQANKELEQIKKQKVILEVDRDQLSKRLANYVKNYDDALKKNKKFENEIKNLPKKFSEIARQNKALIKETAEMHYNLGVFYTKHKEYERALAEFGKVIDIEPNDAYAHFNLGYIYAEYMVNRKRAINHFRQYLRLIKSDDKDIDWVRKYLLTWETFEGKKPMD